MNVTPGLPKGGGNQIHNPALWQDRLSTWLVNKIAPGSRRRGCMV